MTPMKNDNHFVTKLHKKHLNPIEKWNEMLLTSFVTDSGNKTIPLPLYSRSFITFLSFFNGKSIPFVMKNDFHVRSQFFVHQQVNV